MTDGIQMVVMILANITIAVLVLVKYGGSAGVVDSLVAAHGGDAQNILNIMPQPGHRVFGPLMMFTWLFVISVGKGGDVTFEGQRILSCRSYKDAAKVTIWGQITLYLLLLTISLPVLGVLITHPQLYHADIVEREQTYGIILREYLPTGVLGLALSALMAAAMSTVSTHLNYGSQTLVNDVYKPLLGKISGKKAVWLGRMLMIFMVAASVLVMLYAKSLINIAIVLAGILGASASLYWGQWWWWRVNLWSWITANVGGPIMYFVLKFILEHTAFWQERIAMGGSMTQQMNMLLAALGIVVTTLLWIVVTLFTKSEDFESLKKFYRRARPEGIWGPIRKAVEQEDKENDTYCPVPNNLLLGGMYTSVVGVGFIALIILFIAEFYVGRYFAGGVLLVATIITGFWFKKAFNWHLLRVTQGDELRKQSIIKMENKVLSEIPGNN